MTHIYNDLTQVCGKVYLLQISYKWKQHNIFQMRATIKKAQLPLWLVHAGSVLKYLPILFWHHIIKYVIKK